MLPVLVESSSILVLGDDRFQPIYGAAVVRLLFLFPPAGLSGGRILIEALVRALVNAIVLPQNLIVAIFLGLPAPPFLGQPLLCQAPVWDAINEGHLGKVVPGELNAIVEASVEIFIEAFVKAPIAVLVQVLVETPVDAFVEALIEAFVKPRRLVFPVALVEALLASGPSVPPGALVVHGEPRPAWQLLPLCPEGLGLLPLLRRRRLGCSECLIAHHYDHVQVPVLIESSVILVLGDDRVQVCVLIERVVVFLPR